MNFQPAQFLANINTIANKDFNEGYLQDHEGIITWKSYSKNPLFSHFETKPDAENWTKTIFKIQKIFEEHPNLLDFEIAEQVLRIANKIANSQIEKYPIESSSILLKTINEFGKKILKILTTQTRRDLAEIERHLNSIAKDMNEQSWISKLSKVLIGLSSIKSELSFFQIDLKEAWMLAKNCQNENIGPSYFLCPSKSRDNVFYLVVSDPKKPPIFINLILNQNGLLEHTNSDIKETLEAKSLDQMIDLLKTKKLIRIETLPLYQPKTIKERFSEIEHFQSKEDLDNFLICTPSEEWPWENGEFYITILSKISYPKNEKLEITTLVCKALISAIEKINSHQSFSNILILKDF